MQLNAAQRLAVEHPSGPLLVLAGAGSGKTRVITARIAHLLARGVAPDAILAVSFTNKAAGELGERMVKLVGHQAAGQLWLSTFHSFGRRFLNEERKHVTGRGRFVVFDQSDCVGLVRDLQRQHVRGDKRFDTKAVLARISIWKNELRGPDDVVCVTEYDDAALEIYPAYLESLENMHAVDFDDLVLRPVQILRDHPKVRERWRDRFRHLLVDEFQDTNACQLELVRLLANEEANVCVVGDDDQSIYGWRGACVENILNFERHFPGATVTKLEQNYRSHDEILMVANAAIEQSKRRHKKTLRTTRGNGERVRLVTCNDASLEAKFVAQEIRQLLRDRALPSDIAVLYRSNTQARLVEEELRVSGTPYRIYGGTEVFDRKEIRDAIAFLRVLVNPRDELSLRRIMNHPPRGIGTSSIVKLQSFAQEKGIGLFTALKRASNVEGLPNSAKQGAAHLVESLRKADARRKSDSLALAAQALFEDVGLIDHLRSESGQAAKIRVENLEFLIGSIQRFEAGGSKGLAHFLSNIALDKSHNDEGAPGQLVTLSSLHSAKGLEFPIVFLIGCVEGILPHSRTTDPRVTDAVAADLDEERRLFYVGVTRARDLLYLSRPKERVHRGRVAPLTPSRFLQGLPSESIQDYRPAGQAQMNYEDVSNMAAALLEQLQSR